MLHIWNKMCWCWDSLLEGDEVLLVLVVRFSVGDICDVHHCGDKQNVAVRSFSTLAAHLITQKLIYHHGVGENRLAHLRPEPSETKFVSSCHKTPTLFHLWWLLCVQWFTPIWVKCSFSLWFQSICWTGRRNHFSSNPLIIRPKKQNNTAAAKPISSESCAKASAQAFSRSQSRCCRSIQNADASILPLQRQQGWGGASFVYNRTGFSQGQRQELRYTIVCSVEERVQPDEKGQVCESRVASWINDAAGMTTTHRVSFFTWPTAFCVWGYVQISHVVSAGKHRSGTMPYKPDCGRVDRLSTVAGPPVLWTGASGNGTGPVPLHTLHRRLQS